VGVCSSRCLGFPAYDIIHEIHISCLYPLLPFVIRILFYESVLLFLLFALSQTPKYTPLGAVSSVNGTSHNLSQVVYLGTRRLSGSLLHSFTKDRRSFEASVRVRLLIKHVAKRSCSGAGEEWRGSRGSDLDRKTRALYFTRRSIRKGKNTDSSQISSANSSPNKSSTKSQSSTPQPPCSASAHRSDQSSVKSVLWILIYRF